MHNSSEQFTDPRDGRAYSAVQIGKQTWFAENLAFRCENCCCYKNEQKNAEKYGFLYTWEAAKKAVPPGWHLPSNDEWDELLRFIDGAAKMEMEIPYDSETAGKKLKAQSGWDGNGNGTNQYGFSALPGGFCNSNGRFACAGRYASWWSASEFTNRSTASTGAYKRALYIFDYTGWDINGKNCFFSVHCVKDASE